MVDKVVATFKTAAVTVEEWIGRLLTTPAIGAAGTIGQSLNERVKALTTLTPLAFDSNDPESSAFRVSRSWPATRALSDLDKAPLGDTWYGIQHTKRGRMVSASVEGGEDDPARIVGPMVTDGKGEIFLSPRIGAALFKAAARMQDGDAKAAQMARAAYTVAVVFVHHYLLLLMGEPEPTSAGAAPLYGKRADGKTFAAQAKLFGFDTAARTADDNPDRYRLTTETEAWLFNIIQRIGAYPAGAIDAVPTQNAPQGTRLLKVVCPYNAADGTIKNADRDAAVLDGRIHFVGRATLVYLRADALGACLREHKDAKGKIVKGVVRYQMEDPFKAGEYLDPKNLPDWATKPAVSAVTETEPGDEVEDVAAPAITAKDTAVGATQTPRTANAGRRKAS